MACSSLHQIRAPNAAFDRIRSRLPASDSQRRVLEQPLQHQEVQRELNAMIGAAVKGTRAGDIGDDHNENSFHLPRRHMDA